ncbi:PRC-barrel domain protein [Roseivivax jejudonensis]|uniref:PRC-barrel domain protein n=1 Tax=Roseivivax jejudonensis TaxID=1529041 RepID=A0A1X6YA72_9RHOB|nr:PRC-barrel domain-containing protein [Roseivivax jejudonensis]SLN15333.1 PRC-barrel domain protein [Roseivivax jejudonensis]
MLRTLLSGLLAAGLALPVLAQESGDASSSSSTDSAGSASDSAGGDAAETEQPPYITATMLQEARIVSLEGEYDANTWESDAPLQPIIAGLSEIGSVSEVLLDDRGQVQGITTDVGGFIGIGQKTVMIPLNDLRLARSPEGDTITIVTRLDQSQLEDAPEIETADD